jgi:endonuclease/exonuclease/phosphatase (EEP) superfamily protein YafD
MTHNVGNGLAGATRLERGLRYHDADIVALQEVARSQLPALEAVRDLYPHQVRNGLGIPGKAILSRFPIREHAPLDFHPNRPDLRAVVEQGERELAVIVAHPLPVRPHPTGLRFNAATEAQIAQLSDLASRYEDVLLMGDLNMTRRHRHYARFLSIGLTDAFASAGRGRGYTLPVRIAGVRSVPFVRFDYIWHSGRLGTLSAWLGADAGSDHLPVVAHLRWKGV